MTRFLHFILAILFLTGIAHAGQPSQDAQKIVDELRDMANKARKERSADPWLLKAMDDLVQRYGWPWRRSVLNDSFADGDFSKNPAWQVASGNFWVDKSLGLRSKAAPAAADKGKVKFKDALKEALLAEVAGAPPQADPAIQAAEIFLPGKINNAFALDASFSLHHSPGENGHIEFGLFEGNRRDRGYVLAVYTGQANTLELQRISTTGTSIIERKSLPAGIETGALQKISWRRDPQGAMVVLLNDKSIIQAQDRGLTGNFNSFGLANRGGDFAVKQVALADAG